MVRSVKLSAKDAAFACCPRHAASSVDPHWWHSISGMKKAASYVAKEFGKADPANKKSYAANAKTWRKELDALETWAKREISKIPRSKRYLVTAHAAFGYFCRDFGFKSIPVAGASEEGASSKYLAEAIGKIREHRVPTAFPDGECQPTHARFDHQDDRDPQGEHIDRRCVRDRGCHIQGLRPAQRQSDCRRFGRRFLMSLRSSLDKGIKRKG